VDSPRAGPHWNPLPIDNHVCLAKTLSGCGITSLQIFLDGLSAITLIHVWFPMALVRRGRGHRVLSLTPKPLLENLALRQQITVLKRRHPRPKLSPLDKLFWLLARKYWSAWKQSLFVVTPETVVHSPRRISSVLVPAFAPSRSLGRNPAHGSARGALPKETGSNR
jgi:hypothetical protein